MIIKENLDLTEYNSYKVHSIAGLALFPESVDDVRDILSKYDISQMCIVGKGCNTILAKEYYPASQPFLFIRDNFSDIDQQGETLRVLAGTDLKELSVYAMEHSYTGLEYFYDIPGCVGGAITMNAGSCGVSFTDYIIDITYIECETQKILTIEKEKIKTGYRESLFKGNNKNVILECTLKLPKGKKEEIKQQMEDIVLRRTAKQPREYPNAGSVFIRPAENIYVGPMIEKLGLKGYRIGGAEISTKHAGFIVNVDSATGQDIVNLIDFVRKQVKTKFNINLQVEQRVLL